MRTERSLQPSREAIASVLSTLAAIRSSSQDRAVAIACRMRLRSSAFMGRSFDAEPGGRMISRRR
jgi:hypothetical protein